MERYVFLRRTFYFIELCKKSRAGTRKELATKLEMSESGIKRMITDLRDAGLNIEYDSLKRTYFIKEEMSILI